MTTTNRDSLMVDILDTDKVTMILREVLVAQYGGDADDIVADDLIIAPIPGTDNGWGKPRHAIICTEGVGWEQDEYQRILLPGSAGIRGVATTVGVCRLLKECRTGEQINLADHIRTFGDRLERNHSLWHHRLTVGDTNNG